MKDILQTIFKKEYNIIIGAIHFPPLLGYPEFPGYEIALTNALADLRAFEVGAADAIIIENNYDIPHKEFVDPSVAESLTILAEKIRKETSLPMGISVLWNDYKTALTIAKKVGLQFIRIPVFVDTAKTSYGTVVGNPKAVIEFRKSINAEDVAIFTDIHVKHAEILSTYTIEESALLAIKEGSDGLIITGKWTGQAPNLDEIKSVRKTVGTFPILCGSGVDAVNIKELYAFANGAIVSTSLKEGAVDAKEINIKPYSGRISLEKVSELVKKVQ
jgi:membrane complex biogenesis BtpA family protein